MLPLLAATYFMVSGGPYGLEEIIGDAGYGWALIILFVLPFFWSLPTSLMIGELAAAVPEEGGFYAWVRRAMGPFWERVGPLTAALFSLGIAACGVPLYALARWKQGSKVVDLQSKL